MDNKIKVIVELDQDVYYRLINDGFVNAGNTYYNTLLNSIMNGTPVKNCSECLYHRGYADGYNKCRNCQIIVHSHFKEAKNGTT